MCGRFTLTTTEEELAQVIPGTEVVGDWKPRYNIAPTQPVATVLNTEPRQVITTRWGLIPSWAKDPEIGHRLINARAETLSEKPSFRRPLQRQRCVILADGFYEWQVRPGQTRKQPMYLRLKTHKAFALAGLWDRWRDPGGETLTTSTIITTAPNALVEPIHNRMPVILRPEFYDLWLDPQARSAEDWRSCWEPYPMEAMEAIAVSTRVNSPAVDDPSCVKPMEPLSGGSGGDQRRDA